MSGEKNSKYKPEYDELAFNYSLMGATDKQLATFFDVTEKTINTWKEKHPTFLQSLKRGKQDADANVVKSLYKRALGYEYVEEKQEDGTNGSKTTTTNKHVAGDTTAAIFWLKNRQPDVWREKKELQVTSSNDFSDWNED